MTRTSGHLPFGENWYPNPDTSKWKFTSYERDADSGVDQAIFRYYRSGYGRFTSPDPLMGSVARPQSLNRYAYVQGDPVALLDPVGLDPSLLLTDSKMTCTVDGMWTPCGLGAGLVLSGAGGQCPQNLCTGMRRDGTPVEYRLFPTGGGYYALFGPGSVFFSIEAAGKAALKWYFKESVERDAEAHGNIYVDQATEVISYTAAIWGPSGAGYADYDTSVPEGTRFVGDYHLHGRFHPESSEGFSGKDEGLFNIPYPHVSFLGEDTGRGMRIWIHYPGLPGSEERYVVINPDGTVWVNGERVN